MTVDVFPKSINIKWIPPECINIQGPLTYNISIICIHDPWCDQVRSETREVDGFNNGVQVPNLTPFTNYTLELRAIRSGAVTEQSITVPFRTKEGGTNVFSCYLIMYIRTYSTNISTHICII